MKKGFIAGAFDLLHPGHLHILREAKKYCDLLIVGLHIDPSNERENKNRPVQTVYERFIQLRSCKYVDGIIPYETEQDLLNILSIEGFDIRFLGSDYDPKPMTNEYNKKQITGENLVPIKYIPRLHSYSSTELRERLK